MRTPKKGKEGRGASTQKRTERSQKNPKNKQETGRDRMPINKTGKGVAHKEETNCCLPTRGEGRETRDPQSRRRKSRRRNKGNPERNKKTHNPTIRCDNKRRTKIVR